MNPTLSTHSQFSLAHFWAQGDFVSHAVALCLVLMSVLSWYVILRKAYRSYVVQRQAKSIEQFWQSKSVEEGIKRMREHAPHASTTYLAQQAGLAAQHGEACLAQEDLAARFSQDEFLTRALRSAITVCTTHMERGLTTLASIGSTAPFVGLFGTVWGIYHALMQMGLSANGQTSIDQVAGPVGEALIMTAAGLFVAIPAVLAYNAATRANRVEQTLLDGFAHDLHAYFTTGARITHAHQNAQLASLAAQQRGKPTRKQEAA